MRCKANSCSICKGGQRPLPVRERWFDPMTKQDLTKDDSMRHFVFFFSEIAV